MTEGLLVSIKIIGKKSIKKQQKQNKERYKIYLNIYNK